MRGPRVGECIVLLPLATPGVVWWSGAGQSVGTPDHTSPTDGEDRVESALTVEMRGWIPTVQSNGEAHRMVWLGEGANFSSSYGEMISTCSSALSGLKWLI